MMTFLYPLDALIPKIPVSFFFADFLGLGHLRGPGVSLGRFLGVLSIEPFWGGSGRRALSPPPHANENPASHFNAPRTCGVKVTLCRSRSCSGGLCLTVAARLPHSRPPHQVPSFVYSIPRGNLWHTNLDS